MFRKPTDHAKLLSTLSANYQTNSLPATTFEHKLLKTISLIETQIDSAVPMGCRLTQKRPSKSLFGRMYFVSLKVFRS